jgi:Xaa-Pro aminopeptidase/Xaa-Pro dipeptidase
MAKKTTKKTAAARSKGPAPKPAAKARPKPPGVSPTQAYLGRLANLRAALGRVGVSHFLVTNPKDVAYLTGFLGGDSFLLVALVGEAKPLMISDFRYQEELEPVRPVCDIFIRPKSMPEAVGHVLGAAHVDRLGVQADHLTIAMRDSIGNARGSVGPNRLVEITGVVAKLRAVKDEMEVGLITKAVRIQEQALQAVMKSIKPGVTERELAGRLEAEMKALGSREPGFQTIVAAGATGSLPHYRPEARKLEKGKSVLIDWGAVYQGYHSDMTRVLSLGKWPAKIEEIYKIVLEAHTAAAKALAPGKTTQEIDAVARKIISDAGYGLQYGHGLGHGIGMNGHEDPFLSHMLAPMPLEAGHVVTIEPGIYLPGIGGVRIEDDYLVTPTGARNLCTLPKDLGWAKL